MTIYNIKASKNLLCLRKCDHDGDDGSLTIPPNRRRRRHWMQLAKCRRYVGRV